jgi:hypothetical protein
MLLSKQLLLQSFTIFRVMLMFVYLLLAGGLLYGSAAFAGTRAYLLAGIAFAAWLAALGGRSAWRALGRAGDVGRAGGK